MKKDNIMLLIVIVMAIIMCLGFPFMHKIGYTNGYAKARNDNFSDHERFVAAVDEQKLYEKHKYAEKLCKELTWQRLSSGVAVCLTEVEHCAGYNIRKVNED